MYVKNVNHQLIKFSSTSVVVHVNYIVYSGRGAYHSSMVYRKTEITAIIDYARDRGVRVIPEFDVPGKANNVYLRFRTLPIHTPIYI